MRRTRLIPLLLAAALPAPLLAQAPVGRIVEPDAREVKVFGSVAVENGGLSVANGSTVTSPARTTRVSLTRGGSLNICATTSVQLTEAGKSLMLSLERGALETHNDMQGSLASDVVQTPDLRIVISPPGQADVRVRVSPSGDTCVENHGTAAPYVTVTPQLGDGLYRVAAGQRVLFEKGDLHQVVDHEPDPCGCPAPEPARPEDFPLAVSQGLAPAAPAPTQPAVPAGQVHAEVAAQLAYNSDGTPVQDSSATPPPTATPLPAAPPPPAVATPPPATPVPPAPSTSAPNPPRPAVPAPAATQTAAIESAPNLSPAPSIAPAASPATTPAPASAEPPAQTDLVHAIGHFFSRLFGRHPRANS